MSEPSPLHLWEVEHDYYCNEGNFHQRGQHATYSTWGDFIESCGGWDEDRNLLFRWDWDKPEAGVMGTLSLYFIGQRKANNWSISVPVHPDEEQLVREYLQPRLDHLAKLWAPLVPAVPGQPERAS